MQKTQRKDLALCDLSGISAFSALNFITAITKKPMSEEKKDTRYINEIFSLKCGPELLLSEAFPNSKEFTEQAGAYNAAKKYFREELPLKDPNVVCICVGDGINPRAAIMFAYRTAWMVYSVDPRLNVNKKYKIDRLKLINKKIEEVTWKIEDKPVLAIAVHAHINLEVLLDIPNLKGIIAIPCCRPQEKILGNLPNYEYKDYGIWSEKRTVKIWKWGGLQKEDGNTQP